MKILSLFTIAGLTLIAASDLSADCQDDYVAGFIAGAQFADELGFENHKERIKKRGNDEIYKQAAVDAYKNPSQ